MADSDVPVPGPPRDPSVPVPAPPPVPVQEEEDQEEETEGEEEYEDTIDTPADNRNNRSILENPADPSLFIVTDEAWDLAETFNISEDLGYLEHFENTALRLAYGKDGDKKVKKTSYWRRLRTITRTSVTKKLNSVTSLLRKATPPEDEVTELAQDIISKLYEETIYTNIIQSTMNDMDKAEDTYKRNNVYARWRSSMNLLEEYLTEIDATIIPDMANSAPTAVDVEPSEEKKAITKKANDAVTILAEQLSEALDRRTVLDGGRNLMFEQYKREDEPKKPVEEPQQDSNKLIYMDNGFKEELPTFTGNFSDWDGWYEQFTALVDNNPRLTKIIKFKKLIHSLEGEAARAVKCFTFREDNYELVKESLQQRFGDPDKVLDELIGKVLSHKPLSDSRPDEYQEYSDMVAQMIHHMKTYAKGSIDNPHVLTYLLEQQLSDEFLLSWDKEQKSYLKINKVPIPKPMVIQKLIEHLQEYVQSMKDLADRKTKPKLSYTKRRQESSNEGKRFHDQRNHNKKQSPTKTTESFLTVAEMTKIKKDKSRDLTSCLFCKGDHSSRKCKKEKPSWEVMWKLVKEANVCMNCLCKGHHAVSCKVSPCGVQGCTRKHHRFLHRK